jgi:hypothetical protein
MNQSAMLKEAAVDAAQLGDDALGREAVGTAAYELESGVP